VRLIVVSNRLYPGILIRGRLSALVRAYEQNVARVYREKRRRMRARATRRYLIARPTCVLHEHLPIYLPTCARVCFFLRCLPASASLLGYPHLKSGWRCHGTCTLARTPTRTTKRSYQSAVVKVSTATRTLTRRASRRRSPVIRFPASLAVSEGANENRARERRRGEMLFLILSSLCRLIIDEPDAEDAFRIPGRLFFARIVHIMAFADARRGVPLNNAITQEL